MNMGGPFSAVVPPPAPPLFGCHYCGYHSASALVELCWRAARRRSGTYAPEYRTATPYRNGAATRVMWRQRYDANGVPAVWR